MLNGGGTVTTGLNNKQARIINVLAWVLLTILLGYGAWLGNKFYELKVELPAEYVRLERYTCDINKLEKRLERIEGKLDHFIVSHQDK